MILSGSGSRAVEMCLAFFLFFYLFGNRSSGSSGVFFLNQKFIPGAAGRKQGQSQEKDKDELKSRPFHFHLNRVRHPLNKIVP